MNRLVRLPSGARELRTDDALVRPVVRVSGHRRERARVGQEAVGRVEGPELRGEESADEQRLGPAVLVA